MTTVLIAVVVFCLLSLATVAVVLGVGAFVPAVSMNVEQMLSADADLGDPGQLAALLGAVCLLWPAVALGVRWGGKRPVGTLSSVSGRLRWRLFPKPLALAAALFLVTSGMSLLLPVDTAFSWAGPAGSGGAGEDRKSVV